MIRATTGHRLLFSISAIVLMALSFHVFRKEARKEWIGYQRQFKSMYETILKDRIAELG